MEPIDDFGDYTKWYRADVAAEVGELQSVLFDRKIAVQYVSKVHKMNIWFKTTLYQFNIWVNMKTMKADFVIFRDIKDNQYYSTCSNYYYRSKCFCQVTDGYHDKQIVVSGVFCQGSKHEKLSHAIEFSFSIKVIGEGSEGDEGLSLPTLLSPNHFLTGSSSQTEQRSFTMTTLDKYEGDGGCHV